MTEAKRYLTGIGVLLAGLILCFYLAVGNVSGFASAQVQGQVILTVSEGKRLIGKAVAEMDIVKKALKDGMVIITRGTTNTYVAEEILGRKIEHSKFVLGKVYPAKGGKELEKSDRIGDIILIKGVLQSEMSLEDALNKLQAADVVIKGANAVNQQAGLAAVIAGSSSGGTSGKILPYVTARKAYLVVPVGLEKQVSGNVLDITRKMKEPLVSLNDIPTMFLLQGEVVTEIEAMRILAGVEAFQAAAGGIGGAEGAAWLVCRGEKENVQKALNIAKSIQGELPFVK